MSIIDNFVIEHDQERKELLGFFENSVIKSMPNEYNHIIYKMSESINRKRFTLAAGLFSTSLATVALGMIHPLAPIILAYDYVMLIRYMSLLNNTVVTIQLAKDKRTMNIETLNYFGFLKKPDRFWRKILT